MGRRNDVKVYNVYEVMNQRRTHVYNKKLLIFFQKQNTYSLLLWNAKKTISSYTCDVFVIVSSVVLHGMQK